MNISCEYRGFAQEFALCLASQDFSLQLPYLPSIPCLNFLQFPPIPFFNSLPSSLPPSLDIPPLCLPSYSTHAISPPPRQLRRTGITDTCDCTATETFDTFSLKQEIPGRLERRTQSAGRVCVQGAALRLVAIRARLSTLCF